MPENHTKNFIQENLSHICASYQQAAVEVLVVKTLNAAKDLKVRSVGIVGGVAANTLLRKWLAKEVNQTGFEFFLPDFQYCTDNAAMIARAGFERLKQCMFSQPGLNAYPSLRLTDNPSENGSHA